MNKTVDPKIARAITAFEVKFFTQEGKGIRKLVLTLRPNMYTEAGEISRTIDSEGNTTDIQEIKWKQGTEKVRKDSVFSLFTASDDMDPFFIQETFDAFDGLYQNPFI
ncbi:hypothetical protein AGDE_06347 [Angomonas deanei]|nr:hypothetical protein AGDE_07958 [Angomonas deanei]EPY37587.1 hypothetical protein AGDE_06347 [Angomonas deanei]|eukprot:EPY34354.1 hypothetical protein AGDE_07958 [Angomonas deanei]